MIEHVANWFTNQGTGLELRSQVIVILLSWTLMAPLFFAINSSIVDFKLNKSAIRKRKKRQSFFEWLMFSRFRDITYKSTIVMYFIALFGLPGLALVCVVLSWCTDSTIPGCVIARMVYLTNGIESMYVLIVFGNNRYKRWMKRRGMPKRK